MKLLLLLIIASATALETHEGIKVQLCGARLAKALKKVCEEKDIDFLLQHGQYTEEADHLTLNDDNQSEHDHNHGHHSHHNHSLPTHNHGQVNHNHGQVNHNHEQVNHNHGQVNHVRKDSSDSCHHGSDHRTHDHQHGEGSWKLADECCAKPCLVRDFIAFCH